MFSTPYLFDEYSENFSSVSYSDCWNGEIIMSWCSERSFGGYRGVVGKWERNLDLYWVQDTRINTDA